MRIFVIKHTFFSLSACHNNAIIIALKNVPQVNWFLIRARKKTTIQIKDLIHKSLHFDPKLTRSLARAIKQYKNAFFQLQLS